MYIQRQFLLIFLCLISSHATSHSMHQATTALINLPQEIVVHQVCPHLDLASLSRFLTCSKQYLEVATVKTFLQYIPHYEQQGFIKKHYACHNDKQTILNFINYETPEVRSMRHLCLALCALPVNDEIDNYHKMYTKIDATFIKTCHTLTQGNNDSEENTSNSEEDTSDSEENNSDKIVTILSTLLFNGANINTQDKTLLTALHYFIHNSSVTHYLISQPRINPNIIDCTSQTALISFVTSIGQINNFPFLAIFEDMCTKEISIQEQQELYEKYNYEVSEIVKIITTLLDHPETDLNLGDCYYQETPLHCAAKTSLIELVRLLLDDARTDYNAVNIKGETALHLVINAYQETQCVLQKKNYRKITKLLLQYVNPNTQDNFGNTALMLAAKKANAKFIALLLNHTMIDPLIVNSKGKTALDYANSSHLCKDALERYLEKGK